MDRTGPSIEDLLEANVEQGWMEHAGVDDDGQRLYRMTEAGKAYVEAMMADRLADGL